MATCCSYDSENRVGNRSDASSRTATGKRHREGDETDPLEFRITEAATNLRSSISVLELKLQQEQEDNASLRAEVAQWRRMCRELVQIDVSTLRRRLAFHVHPDVGGDARLMSEINAACDCIVRVQTSTKEAA
jgi:glucose-6-phosphate-specific signal transduction histidine kinase